MDERDIETLKEVARHYVRDDKGFDNDAERLFSLLVGVGVAYMVELDLAHPSRVRGVMEGLIENLEMAFDPNS
jgi:hypothetical protein